MLRKALLALVGVAILAGPMIGLLAIAVLLTPAASSAGAGCVDTQGPTGGRLAADAPVPDRARPWIRKAAATCPDLPEVWIAAVMAQESDFQPDVFALDRNGGTWGLFQINEYLWKQVYGPWDTDRDGNGVWDIKQPLIHAEYGARYLCNLLERVRETRKEHPDWPSSTELTVLEALVVAHNAGPGRLETYPDLPAVTEEYLADVRERMRTWAASNNSSTNAQAALSPGQVPSAGHATERVVMPIPEGLGIITSPYGRRTDPFGSTANVMHYGTDFAAPKDTPILAVASGTVLRAEMVPGDAGTIALEHRFEGRVVVTRYKHMWADGIHVEPGDEVVAGQHIGDVGSSGYSTGPHLHLEVRPGGRDADTIDPMPWLDKRGAIELAKPTNPDNPGNVANCTPEQFAAAAPEPFRGEPGGRIEDPTGTGGWITRQTQHMLEQTQAAFPDSSWSCWYQSSGGDHPLGNACDVTFGNSIGEYPIDKQRQAGWDVAKWLKRYADELRIDYLIWQGKIWSTSRSDEGWRKYDGGGFGDPNDVTGGHYDHLHISVH